MHLFDGNGMDARFRLAEELKGARGALLYAVPKSRGVDDSQNRGQRAVMCVTGRVFVFVRSFVWV
jgi:hypothetical protein